MKKILNFFLTGVAIAALSTATVACNDPGNNDDPKLTGVLPASVSDVPEEVSAFLGERLMLSLPEYFERFERNTEVCLTVNSEEELRQIAPSDSELPGIDFEKYTLVIGRYRIPQGGIIIESQSINTYPDVMKLNLVLRDTGKGLAAVCYPAYCSLYPKLPSKRIEFDRTYAPYQE